MSGGGGIGLAGLLFLVFLVLKLTGVIAWSWWLVTLPLWGGLALFLGFFLVGFVVLGIGALVAGRMARRRG